MHLIDAILSISVAAPAGRPDNRPPPLRRRLLDHIRSRPGIHASELARDVDSPWATVQYHLNLLRKAELVSTMPAGREQRLFADDVDPTKARLLCLLEQGRRMEIASFIVEHPGTRQVDICSSVGVSRKVFRASVRPLVDEGILEERRGVHSNQYFAGPTVDDALEHGLSPMLDDPSLS